MVRSKSILWITFAFCVTTASCTDFIVQIGGEVVMDCSNPDLNDVVWKLNNVLLLGKKKSGSIRKGGLDTTVRARIEGTATLKISPLKSSDSGDYTCGASKHKLYIASAYANPSLVLISSDTTLSCDVAGGFKGTFQWYSPKSTMNIGKGKDVTVKSVTSDHAGQWSCHIKNENNAEVKLYVDVSVVGPLSTSAEITISEWGTAELPCFLPAPSKLPIKGGSWKREPPSCIHLPTLMKTESGLKWNSTSVSTAKDQILNPYFNLTLKKVKQADSGVYVCSLEFEGGKSLSANVSLTVLKSDGVPPGMNPGDSAKLNMWHKRVWGMQLWIWIAIAASSLVLICLVAIVLLIHCRNKRMKRKMKTLKSMQQPLTSRNYCKCVRPSVTAMQPRAGKRERPPPLPRHQYSSLNE